MEAQKFLTASLALPDCEEEEGAREEGDAKDGETSKGDDEAAQPSKQPDTDPDSKTSSVE